MSERLLCDAIDSELERDTNEAEHLEKLVEHHRKKIAALTALRPIFATVADCNTLDLMAVWKEIGVEFLSFPRHGLEREASLRTQVEQAAGQSFEKVLPPINYGHEEVTLDAQFKLTVGDHQIIISRFSV